MEFLTADSPEYKTEIKRSEFICIIKKVASEDEARAFIAERRKIHSLATHNCYAYIVSEGGTERVRYSDDGEPQGTAGQPILNVLKNKGFKNVVAVVTRYFGGVKLGAGGLVRAYSEACAGAAAVAKVLKCVLCSKFLAEFTYENYKKFSAFRLPENARVCETEYGEKVSLSLIVKKEDSESFLSSFNDFFCKKQAISPLSDVWADFEV